MKRVFSLLLVIALCFGLCACGGGSKESEKSPSEAVTSAVKSRIMVEIALGYDTVGVPSITTYVDEVSSNLYEVTGKVTVKDKYGDSYTGKYDAEVEYDPATGDCDVDLELGKLYKD